MALRFHIASPHSERGSPGGAFQNMPQGFASGLAPGRVPGHVLPLGLFIQVFLQLLVASPSVAREPQDGGAPAPAPPRGKASEDLERAASSLENVFRALEEASAQLLPATVGDVPGVVASVGKDPAQLLDWVRSNTRLVPYRGVLRDGRGVLLDGLGNSLDRALLLHQMLTAAGMESRLANSTLEASEAEKLMDLSRRNVEEPPLGPEMEALDELARAYGLNPARAHDILERLTAQRRKLSDDLGRRVEEQTVALERLLDVPSGGRDLVDPAATQAMERKAAVETLRDHWWVQVPTSSGWLDLDPTVDPGAPAGARRAAGRTIAANRLDETLRDEVHEIVVEVVIERWTKGELSEAVVLSQPLRPFAFIGERISIHHAPLEWPEDLKLLSSQEPAEVLRGAALAQHEWMPVLAVGSQRATQATFTDSGAVQKPKKLPAWVKASLAAAKLTSAVEEGAAAVGGRIGGLLGGGARGARPASTEALKPILFAAAPPGSVLTAEWIDYEIRSPGRSPRRVRREVFDLLGPAARAAADRDLPPPALAEKQRLERALALLGETELLPLVCGLPEEYAASLAAKQLLANRKALLSLLRDPGLTDIDALLARTGQLEPLPSPLNAFGALRHGPNARRSSLYLDRINLVSFHSSLRADAAGSDVLVHRAFDIVDNFVAVDPTAPGDPRRARVRQGVLDTNLEFLLFQDPSLVDSPAELLARSLREAPAGADWMPIRSVEDEAWGQVDASSDLRARIGEDLTAGYVVLVPKTPLLVEGKRIEGWWRMDPRTGQTLGVGGRGWGQTATEKSLVKASIWYTAKFTLVFTFVCFIAKTSNISKKIDTPRTPEELHDNKMELVSCICAGALTGAGFAFIGPGAAKLGAFLGFLCEIWI